jgi:hypothetical protein
VWRYRVVGSLGLLVVAAALGVVSCSGGTRSGDDNVPIGGLGGLVTELDTGDAVRGVSVHLVPSGPTASTTGDGGFLFASLNGQTYDQVAFTRTGYRTRYVDFPGLGGFMDVQLEYVGAGQVTGQVYDAEGRPVEGARVEVLGVAQSARTDASGRYALYDAPGGLQTIRGGAIGYAVQTVDVKVTDGARVSRNIQLDRSAAQSSLTGVVTDALTREPIAGATLWLGTKRTISDQEGVYMFFELRVGETPLSVSAPGYRTATLSSPLAINLGQNVYNIVLLPDGYIEPPPPA